MIGYNYHLEISELLNDGLTYEQAVAKCEFVFGEDDKEESIHRPKMERRTSKRTKKWLEKTAKKTISNT